MNTEKIVIKDLCKTFKTHRQTITAVQNVNMTVHSGEFVSIVGPSGCGKSTIIRMIDDIIKPTSGTICIDGEPVSREKRISREMIRKIGFTFQIPNMYPWLTVRENVALPLRIFNLKGPEWEENVNDLLGRTGLMPYADTYPNEISGGVLQRAGVVRAMVHKPEILLMDEPFGALDELTRTQMDMEILDIWEKTKMTIIFITHNVEEAVLLANKTYVMNSGPGRIVSENVIDLEYPRTLDMITDMRFVEYTRLLTDLIGSLDLSKIK